MHDGRKAPTGVSVSPFPQVLDNMRRIKRTWRKATKGASLQCSAWPRSLLAGKRRRPALLGVMRALPSASKNCSLRVALSMRADGGGPSTSITHCICSASFSPAQHKHSSLSAKPHSLTYTARQYWFCHGRLCCSHSLPGHNVTDAYPLHHLVHSAKPVLSRFADKNLTRMNACVRQLSQLVSCSLMHVVLEVLQAVMLAV